MILSPIYIDNHRFWSSTARFCAKSIKTVGQQSCSDNWREIAIALTEVNERNRLITPVIGESFLSLCLGYICWLGCVTFDPILGHTLGLNDLRFSHVSSDPFHIVISRRDDRGADDCEPHVCLHIVLLQSTIAIQIGQLNFRFPHACKRLVSYVSEVVCRFPVPISCQRVVLGHTFSIPVHLA